MQSQSVVRHGNEGKVVDLDAFRRERELDDDFVRLYARIIRAAERGSELWEAVWAEYLAIRRLSA